MLWHKNGRLVKGSIDGGRLYLRPLRFTMDNLAHAVVGAALGRAIADRRMPAPAFTGAVAANAPDWTELFIGLPGDGPSYLLLHRGVTHALLGAALQVGLLTVIVSFGTRWWARRRGADAPPLGPAGLAIAACVLSHLYMDWQGSYGWRPFLPWSGTWYYGDLVAIVDPFFWFVPLVALAWGAPRRWRHAVGYGVPAAVLLVAVCLVAVVTTWVKLALVIIVLVAAAGWARRWFGVAGRRRVSAYAVALLAAYAAAHAIASVAPRTEARATALRRFGGAARWAALTVPGRPFVWKPIYAGADTVAGPDWQVPRHLDDPRVRHALATTREGRAMASFARFLAADVDSTGRTVTVVLRDVRYARAGTSGWGVLAVRLKGARPN